MVEKNGSSHSTNFTVSIEAAEGISTGISAADRAQTIKTAVNKNAQPSDLVQPGHIFPLISQPGGVLTRAGHTEAGTDLARLSGHEPASVIVEVMNEDGTMAKRPELEAFAEKHGIYFTHQKKLEKDKQGLTAYDKLDDYEMPGYEPGRFKIIKNVDDAQGLMSSRATNVTFNDKATGEAEIGKVARNGILIDSTTGQIHALNETRRGIFPFTLFRDNDPESPVLFTLSLIHISEPTRPY
mgnify:CR=1 FL=1